eukprot:CAMPEP_0174934856 /NCGR_PEP_ID=MMETSP1355-20121228/51208_1 /TAXON_ID=464990 /ORGANISM="Hemiselmis tepida, Strain CCMP443" /LENGTH=83 /DNA_ID=CAMNT_0016181493 /DNA_START=24 /DNA_END=272 /DNA_ORIENTATION=-
MAASTAGAQRAEWEMRAEALDIRKQEIETNISIGAVTEEAYRESLLAALRDAKAQQRALGGKPNRLGDWIRIMSEEAGEQPPP